MVELVNTAAIINLDKTPPIPATTGEGAPGFLREVDGYVIPLTLASGSLYRLCRIPSNAKIKSVVLATDGPLDTHNTPTTVLDIGIAYSDSTQDGTPVAAQGLIPTTANNGTNTSNTSYASPNILFGQVTPTSYTAAYGPTDIVFNGTNYDMAKLTNTPLWFIFASTAGVLTTGSTLTVDPGGSMDLIAHVSTAATTIGTAALFAKVTYCV